MNFGVALTLLAPLVGTMIGSAFVFFMNGEIKPKLQKILLGFASGVMVAASVWSLIIPAMDGGGVWRATIGLLLGFGFLLLIDKLTPHLHLVSGPEGPKSSLSKTAMLSLAMTIHNLPEGMAVGVALAGAMAGEGITVAMATALAVGIAIQNIPEGAIVAMPIRASGNSKWKSFLIGSASGAVEPLGGLLVILLTSFFTPFLPYFLAFAAGAMLYVVIEELIPEASIGEHSNISTIGFALGFALMMILDVILG